MVASEPQGSACFNLPVLCVCVYLALYKVFVWQGITCIHVHVYRGQGPVSSSVPFPHHLLRQGLSLNLELSEWLDWPAVQGFRWHHTPGLSHRLGTQTWIIILSEPAVLLTELSPTPCLGVLKGGFQGSNSGPSACKEPSLQPHHLKNYVECPSLKPQVQR